jgi:hypothetical protein
MRCTPEIPNGKNLRTAKIFAGPFPDGWQGVNKTAYNGIADPQERGNSHYGIYRDTNVVAANV